MPDFSGEIDDIHAAFADPVTYTGAGLVAAAITAVYFEEPAPAFQGAGATARRVWFEVRISDLPEEPARGDVIMHNGLEWRVNDFVRVEDLGHFQMNVERD